MQELVRRAKYTDDFNGAIFLVAQASACRVETRLDPLSRKRAPMSRGAAGKSACATAPAVTVIGETQ